MKAAKESNKIVNASTQHPYDLVKDFDPFYSMEVNSIKLGIDSIEKTIDFIKQYTLEPPMTTYSKGAISNVDFIFFRGDLEVVRTLNTPDINIVTMDQGYMPNTIYPSDHISMCADFLLLD